MLRRSRAGYVAVLAEAFTEFGASGRAWTRSDMLELLESAPRTDAVSLEAFDATEVAPGVYLVTDEAVGMLEGRRVRRRRSSLWLRRGERFVLRFHQGTPVPDDGRGPASRGAWTPGSRRTAAARP
jgi:ribonuclease HI